jgi:molecular chaperone GrpE (heat shock protein)
MEESKTAETDIVENAADAIPAGQCADPPAGAGEPQGDTPPEAEQDKLPESLQIMQAGIERLERELKAIAESSGKTAGEIREIHKLYHNEFASRLKSMQEELDRYHEMEKGRMFDGILAEIAKLYSGNESLIEEIADEKVKKRTRYMFMDILQILEANGVSKLKSKPGDKRNTRHCQVVERIPTDNLDLHDTVARSRSTGFYVENRTLVKEPVDIYLFTKPNAGIPAEEI